MPSFLPGPSVRSIASECTRTSLVANSNGGFVTLATLQDPGQALGEQFCLARTYAIEQGDSLAATVQGVSMADMESQCAGFAPTMREHQAQLASQSSQDVSSALQKYVGSTGMPASQLSGNARICLGIGYRTDNAELALASAMVLVGLGEVAYGELLGHHLMNGFGLPRRPDRAVQWFGVTLQALQSGASPLVTANDGERIALMTRALATLSTGSSSGTTLQEAAAEPGFVLPAPQETSN